MEQVVRAGGDQVVETSGERGVPPGDRDDGAGLAKLLA